MTTIANNVKGYFLRWMPEILLEELKKIHYLSVLKDFSEDNEPDLKVIKYLVKQDDYVIDIGANIGVYTKILANLVGPKGRVYSVEPINLTYKILCRNISKLGLNNVIPLNYAISDSKHKATMKIPHYERGGENYYRASVTNSTFSGAKYRYLNVLCTSIDSEFLDIAHKVTFIKCDVEGHELNCLQGAKKLLAKIKPAWLIEVSDDPDVKGSPGQQLFAILKQNQYIPYLFDHGLLRRRTKGENNTNFFFLTDNHLDELISGKCRLVLT